MSGDADLSAIGFLLADRTRATILLSLLNGGLTPSSVLADRAQVSRPLASAHLRKLAEGGLVVVEPRGRQRLYRLASQSIAVALEVLILLSPPSRVHSLRGSREGEDLRRARLCYDHLAGLAAVVLSDGLVARGILVRGATGYDVTGAGVAAFATLGIDVDALRTQERPLTRACMDWSERRHHLAGSLGAALTTELLRRDWLRSREASRTVAVTPAGREAIARLVGVQLAAAPSAPRTRDRHEARKASA